MSAALANATRLTAVLQEAAAALATMNAAALLATEPTLARLVGDLRAVTVIDPDARVAFASEVQRVRAELCRCRALGAHATDVVSGLLAIHGHHQYDNLGLTTITAAPAVGRMKAAL